MRSSVDLLTRCALGIAIASIALFVAKARAPVAASVTPVPPAASAPKPEATSAADAEIVALRLTEHVGEARVELPNLARGLRDVDLHWRRMQAPWKDTAGKPRAKLVQLVALRTSASEVAHVVQKKDGALATFDVKKWNMSEGSYAQREAIFAPTPSTLRFRVRVPMHAALEVAPAVLALGEAGKDGTAADVTFVARAVPVGGAPVELGRVVVKPGERDRWHERRFDLASLAGKEVDLELLADAAPKATGVPIPMVLAFWGTPRIVRRAPATLPYNVLFIVVDSLRPDVLASFHDPQADAVKLSSKLKPGDTLLPAVFGLTPNIDALAKRGTVYRNAISAASWTRPGTIAMLSGVYARQLGLSTHQWSLTDAQLDAYYTSDPPLLALAFRRAQAATRAIVNNNFMLGYAQVGVDMGFEHVEDHRYRTMDTAEITKSAIATMRAHAGERWFHFVNYNSPHEPFDPPPECLARVPGAVAAKKPPKKKKPGDEPEPPPAIDPVKAYMAEACKDDAAIGELLAELDRLGLRERTLVVLTADHGETLSEHHEGIAEDLDRVNTRFHHAFGMWEETTRIPILLSLPGVVPENKAVDARVTNLDLAPTILALEGLERDPRMRGIDLVAAARGAAEVPDRPIVTFGRASAALFWQQWRYVAREPDAQKVTVGHGANAKTQTIAQELYDLSNDPGETKNLAREPAFASQVEEMKARLKAALAGVETADAAPSAKEDPPKLLLRFAGGGALHRVHVTIKATGAKNIVATGVGIPAEAIRTKGESVEIATATASDALVGVDLIVTPAAVPVSWTLAYDDKPLSDDAVFGGVLGVTIPGLSKGLLDATLRAAIAARALPFIDPAIDRGVFVVRLGAAEALPPERNTSGAAAAEVQSALKQWGYAK